jgi:hypothetical protein
MKNYIYVMPGGGPFSRFLQCGIIPLADKDFDNVFLTLSPFVENTNNDEYLQEAVDHIVRNRTAMENYGIENPYDHIMSYVLDQKVDRSYVYDGYLPIGQLYDRNNPIEDSARLNQYKAVLDKIHIKGEIKNKVTNFCNSLSVSDRTLGVHVRMTTMTLHNNYKQITYEDYCNTIDQCLDSGKYDNMYVATDNVESLVKMESRYGKYIRYYPNLLRLPTEGITNRGEWSWEYDMFFFKRYWQESFLECMTLSRCGGLVCRDSNFSNMAIVFSNSIKNVYRP